jgi:hypothetical protein
MNCPNGLAIAQIDPSDFGDRRSTFSTVVPCFDRHVIFRAATNAPAKGVMILNASP